MTGSGGHARGRPDQARRARRHHRDPHEDDPGGWCACAEAGWRLLGPIVTSKAGPDQGSPRLETSDRKGAGRRAALGARRGPASDSVPRSAWAGQGSWRAGCRSKCAARRRQATACSTWECPRVKLNVEDVIRAPRRAPARRPTRTHTYAIAPGKIKSNGCVDADETNASLSLSLSLS